MKIIIMKRIRVTKMKKIIFMKKIIIIMISNLIGIKINSTNRKNIPIKKYF